jgi:hypothetical protein
MNTLPVDLTADTLIATWKEARDNEKGWLAVRQEAEAQLIEHFKEEFAKEMAAIDRTRNLTTTVGIGQDMKVCVGTELKVDQVAVIEFLTSNPIYLGVLFKAEYKPVTAALLSKLHGQDDLAKLLQETCLIKEKKPGFSLA